VTIPIAVLGGPTVNVLAFLAGAVVALAAAGVLVTRLERVGERLGFSEAMLGMVAALAADSPEISAAVTALVRGQRDIGVGVILGSNVFNLATLLGLSAIVAGGIAFHRRVVLLEGTVALGVAAISAAVVTGAIPPAGGLALSAAVLVPYLVVSAARRSTLLRLPLPERWRLWLTGAIREEEAELAEAIHPGRGGLVDGGIAAAAVGLVVGASAVMVDAGTYLGERWGISTIVLGGVVLAAVTSLPNAVAGIYLASRGRGAATLSVALNSNTLNVVAGLLIPAAIAGVVASSGGAILSAAWYCGMTLLALSLAFSGRGLDWREGGVIVAAYLVYVVLVVVR
jgi:cation:H+ antiporter